MTCGQLKEPKCYKWYLVLKRIEKQNSVFKSFINEGGDVASSFRAACCAIVEDAEHGTPWAPISLYRSPNLPSCAR